MAVQSVKYQAGDEVWVPVADVLGARPTYSAPADAAMVWGKLAGRVANQNEVPGVPRTWHVNIAGLKDAHGIQDSIPLSSRRFHRYAKILIIRIGDWDTEQPVLNPLAASLKAQLSLLLPPGDVDVEYIRTLEEMKAALRVHGGGPGTGVRAPWGYAVLVGHGRSGNDPGINFGGNWVSPGQLSTAIAGLGPGRKSFSEARIISLCCETGAKRFAEPFSDELGTTFVGPAASVHSYEAAGFVLRLFYEHFLKGRTWSDAFRHTRIASETYSTDFSCWMDGELKGTG